MLFLFGLLQPKRCEALQLLNVLIDPSSVQLELSCIDARDLFEFPLRAGHPSLEVARVNEEVLILLSAKFFIEAHHSVEDSLAHVLLFDRHTPDVHDHALLGKNLLIFWVDLGLQLSLNL